MAVFIKAEPLAGLAGIRHGFFTRRGGVSDGDYATLNCGPGSSDARERVSANRARVAESLGVAPDRLLTVHQVHGAVALPVAAPWPDPANRPQADGLVTATPGLALGALTADCAPVLFADPAAKVIGAAHAGWKGALAGILEATVAAMEELGASRGRILAVVGPTIGRSNYEVGEDFRATALTRDPACAPYFHVPAAGAKPHFDLPGYAAARLSASGVGKVADLGLCTYAGESDFFSFRRATHKKAADYGRQISAIVLV